MKKFNIGDKLEIIGTGVSGIVCEHDFTGHIGTELPSQKKSHGKIIGVNLALKTGDQYMLLSSLDPNKLKKVQ